jgi:glycosyltransferase involved in cell wall biosynthesis
MTDADATGRVGIVSQQYPPDKSGHATRISDMAGNLTSRDWTVEVIAPPPCFPHGEFDRDWYRTRRTTVDDVVVRRLWAWQPTEADPGTVSRLAYYVTFALHAFLWLAITHRRYDAVVTTTPPISTGLAGFVASAAGIPWVVDVRDLWIDASVSLGFIPAGGLLERASRSFQRRVLHAADTIAVTTETLGDRLCEQYGAGLEDSLLLVPNGVDADRFADADDTDPIEETDRPLVVYVGNIGHAQALDTCIRAVGRLDHDVEFRLVGSGDAVPELRRVAAAEGVEDRVRFTGSVPHAAVPSLLAAADVGVAPLLDDAELAYAMPTKVYEYMGAGLPVVTTGRGELRRFIEASGGGIHAAADPEHVAAAFAELLDDERRRQRAGAAGQAHVRSRYDRERIVARLDDRLRALVAGDRPGADAGPRQRPHEPAARGDGSGIGARDDE